VITGAGGMIGQAFVRLCEERGLACRPLSRSELDIADADAVMRTVAREDPQVIINCAAFNHVDRAEDDPAEALTANAFAVRLLARAAAAAGATLVHYSSDFVFDGLAARPYTENDSPNPRSVYAQSKLLGEWFAADAPRWFVLRVESLFGGTPAKGSVDRIAFAIENGQEAKVFVDRTVSPSYVIDVARATKALIDHGEPGLYHCVATGYATWYELAEEIVRVLGRDLDARLVPVSIAEMKLRAERPQFAALDNQKLQRVIAMPTWQDALRRYLA
jgi:dTDP-4-dehydrorhamnose reductase